MAYNIVVTGDTRRLDNVMATLNTFDETTRKTIEETAREIYNEIYPQMLTALQFYPPVPAGSKYKRTFRLKRGWSLTLDVMNSGNGMQIDLVVTNATPYTKWVVGTLTNIDAQAVLTQRAFHARNGWPIALNTTRLWFDMFREAFIDAMTKAIIDMVRKQT